MNYPKYTILKIQIEFLGKYKVRKKKRSTLVRDIFTKIKWEV